MPSPLRFVTVLVVSAAVVVALAATASADSIAYVKDGNVWLTSPDAAKQYQLTFDGGYSSPSQADDGTVVALRARQFVRMDRSGHQLNAPIDAIGTSGGNFYGPYELRVSPDGTRIAYWFGQYSSYYSYGCSCYLYHLESKTAWTYASRFTDPSTESENYLGIEQPEWLTNDRLLAAYPGFHMSGWTFKIGTATGYSDKAAQWWYQFKDEEGYNYFPTDPALSPDGKKLALTNGSDPTKKSQLLLASVPGPAWVGEPPYENDYIGDSAVQQPQLQCWQEKGLVVNPTWSQDSASVAYGSTDGIHVMTVPADWSCAGLADRLLAPGGSEPDWGPADVNLAQKPSPPAATPASGAANAPVKKAGPGAGQGQAHAGQVPRPRRRQAALHPRRPRDARAHGDPRQRQGREGLHPQRRQARRQHPAVQGSHRRSHAAPRPLPPDDHRSRHGWRGQREGHDGLPHRQIAGYPAPPSIAPDGGAGRHCTASLLHEKGTRAMISAPRILAGLAAAGITAAIALTPTTSSNANDASGHQRPDVGARHQHRVIR